MIIKFKPLFLEKIWGGEKLSIIYDLESKNYGECWGISGNKEKSNIIISKEFNDLTLRQLYSEHRELFGNYKSNEFPILLKLIDAKKDLSVQVHPNDDFALKNEKSLGKDEYWYIIECNIDSEIIIGHNAKSKQELANLFNRNLFSKLLNKFKINIGDSFYLHAGTIHAILNNTLVLEVSQSSDTTYRIYDYDRLEKGTKRDLHIEKALEVILVPSKKVIRGNVNRIFTSEVVENNDMTFLNSHIYGDYLTILDGEGLIGEYIVKKGDFLMVTSDSEYTIRGEIKYHKSNIL